MAEIILHDFQGVSIGLNKKDGYVNATKLCTAYNIQSGANKQPSDWTRTRRAKDYISHVASIRGFSRETLIISRAGNHDESGTWIHPDLADPFASWLSVEYEFAVSQWLQEWRSESAKNAAQVLKNAASIDDISNAAIAASKVFTPAYGESLFILNMRRHHPHIGLPEIHASDRSSLPSTEAMLTPTEIAAELQLLYSTGKPNPRAVNALLEKAGLQEKISGQWQPTEKGKSLCDRKPVDTGSRSDKTQLLWYSSVIEFLRSSCSAV